METTKTIAGMVIGFVLAWGSFRTTCLSSMYAEGESSRKVVDGRHAT